MTGCDGDDAGSQAATGDSQVVELERDFSKVLARVRVTQCGDLRGCDGGGDGAGSQAASADSNGCRYSHDSEGMARGLKRLGRPGTGTACESVGRVCSN